MGIIKLIRVGKVKVIDRRSEKGICYKAKCDVCDRIFYPSRNDARYCSQNCAQIAQRNRQGTKIPGTKKTIPAKKKSSK